MVATRASSKEMVLASDMDRKKYLINRISANKAMPDPSTLRHLAKWLRKDVDPDATLQRMLYDLDRQYRRVGPARITSTSRPVRSGVGNGKKQDSRLLRLPEELIGMIKEHLDPAGAVCLAQSCREMHAIFDCSLVDLQRFWLGWIFDKRAPGMKLRRFVFDTTENLDRDRVAELERSVQEAEDLSGEDLETLVCAVCVDTHAARYFSEVQRSLPVGRRRKCIASERIIPICEHWSENLEGLRYWRQALLTAVGDRKTVTAPPDTHRFAGFQAPFELPGCLGDCALTTNCRDELEITRKVTIDDFVFPSSLTWNTVRLIANMVGGRHRICSHVRFGDSVVLEAFDEELISGTPRILPKRGECSRCRTSWWFGTERAQVSVAWGIRFVRFFLAVKQVVGDLHDPWNPEYLALTEGVSTQDHGGGEQWRNRA